MARKDPQNSFDVQNLDVQGDLSTDYALIAVGVGAALAAFAYLLLT
jgi:hypothetical protein